jgi:hypothetical protein
MAYLSPFKLIPFLSIEKIDVDTFDFKLIKRKLLAEFELNDNQPLKVNDTFVGKTEALSILEELKNPEVFRQHCALAKNPELLNFLETSDLHFFAYKANHSLDIPEIISDEFVEKYSELLARFYQQNKSNEIDLLSKYNIEKVKSTVDPFLRLSRKVKGDLIQLEDINNLPNTKQRKEKLKQVIRHYGPKRAGMMNKLPSEFSYLIDDIALQAINLSSDIYNHGKDQKLALALCKFAKSLKCSEQNATIAQENFKIMSGLSSSNGGGSWRTILWVIIAVVKIIFLLSRCN